MNNENPARLNHSLIVIVGAAVILALSLNLGLLVWFTASKDTKDNLGDISSEQIDHGVTSPSDGTPPRDADISGLPPITEEVTQRTPDCSFVEVEFVNPLEPTDLTRYSSLGLDLHDRLDRHTWSACVRGNAGEFAEAHKEIKRLDVIRAESKISDTLKVERPPFEHEQRAGGRIAYSVMFHKGVDLQQAQSMADSMGFELEDVEAGLFSILRAATVIVPDGQLAALAEVDLIARIEPAASPAEPTNQGRGQPLSKVDKVQEEPIGLDGSGVTVGVWEVGGTVLAEHLDLTGRVIIEPGQTSRKSGHATHVAGTIGSSGAYISAAEGMAPNSQIASWDHEQDFNEMLLSGRSTNSGGEPNPVQISNHSYGRCTGWACGRWWGNNNFGAYTIYTGALDRAVAESGIISTWSAGNSLGGGPRGNNDPNRPNNCTAHRYDEFAHGPDVFADCINAENGAKNVITVAAMTDAGSVASFSSYGPMDDGRIKPDLAAQGNPLLSTVPGDSGHVCVGPGGNAPCASAYSGTSMSSPLVAGVAALIMEDVISYPSNPFLRVATRMTPEGMKALLIQTAQDVSGFDQTNPGPDYATGWGIADAEAAVTLLREGGLIQGKLNATGADKAWTQPMTVPSGQLEIHVTLVWTDPPGNPAAKKALVNDLDLRLFAPDGTEFTPWVLGGMADPAKPAVRNGGNDSINNVEQVSVVTPQAGEWLVMVKADRGNMPFPQTFAVAGVMPSDPDLMVSTIRTAPSTGVVRISPTPTPTATPVPGPTPTPTITPSSCPITAPANGPKLSGVAPSTAYQRQLLSLDGETADTRVVWDVGSSNEVDVSPVAPITKNYFQIPKDASPGVHKVAIRNPSGTSNCVKVTVLAPSGEFPAPRIEDIGLRQNGAGEWVLLISGANLDADAIVTVNGASASSALFSGLPIPYMKDHIPTTFKYPVYHYSQLAVVASALPAGATLTLATTNADGKSDNMKYTLPTDWKDVDSDGDGLLDRWEEGTYTAPSGTIINLAAMGVHKYKKDILIEADWVKVAAPPEVVWTKLAEAFANAPVLNPDGTSGVNHIVDRGQGGAFVGGGDVLTPNHTSMSYSSRHFDYESSWYPDSSKLIIGHGHNGKSDIGVINADGSGEVVYLTSSGRENMPFLSPDGTKIAFNSGRDGNAEIYVMNADGTGQTRLTNNSASDIYPSWSPDGAKIAFSSTRDGNYEIYVMNADGTGQTRLTNNSASDIYISWSPDGAKIAFTASRDGNYEIYVMNADGTGQTRLTNNPSRDWLQSWSPDSSKLAFISNRDGHREIYEMNADGSNKRRLMSDKSDKFLPRYSPDGKKISFAKNIGQWLANGGGNYDIHTINTDGTGLTKVTDNSIQEGYVTFATHKERHFNVDRLGIFKYLVLARWSPDALGIAEFPFGGPTQGDDFWVALATWTKDPSRIASVTMHELGHDLGLAHGGIWPNPSHNTSKPNFPSIMSYRYAADGISTDCNNTPDGLLTYTQGQLKDIVETATDESIGICDSKPMDMNNDGQITSGRIDSDGRSGVRGTHRDYDQWGNMVIDFMNR